MEQKVLRFIEKQQLIKQNSTCVVGVSGGPDSMALLHLLYTHRQRFGLRIIVVSIDHSLRAADSEADVAYVRDQCTALEIEFVAVEVDVPTYKREKGLSTQVAARTLRYRAYEEQVTRFAADYLALGHHGDDQIETMLMALGRTTNLKALSGIPLKRAFHQAEIIRPLLVVSREEIEMYCRNNGIHARTDASNEDTVYTRNNLRANVVPHLKRQNNNLHMTMQSLSESLLADEKFIMDRAREIAGQEIAFSKNAKAATFRVNDFNAHPVSLQRRIYRLILDYLYDELPSGLSYVHEEIFLSVFLDGATNKKLDFPNGLKLERTYDQVKIYFADDSIVTGSFSAIVDEIPSSIPLPNGQMLRVTYSKTLETSQSNTYIFSKGQVSFPLHIRNRKPGDRIRLKGLHGSKKLKDLFIDEKIPRGLRDSVYIVADNNGEIMWVVMMKQAELQKRETEGPYISLEYC